MRIKYKDSVTGEVEDLGRIGQPTGIYDFRTGKELLIGDIVEVEYLICTDRTISLESVSVFNRFPFLAQEETGRVYVFGFQSDEYFSSEKFNNNFRNNISVILNESKRTGTNLLHKSNNGNLQELPLIEISSYILLEPDEE